jgi:hypothetical protein
LANVFLIIAYNVFRDTRNCLGTVFSGRAVMLLKTMPNFSVIPHTQNRALSQQTMTRTRNHGRARRSASRSTFFNSSGGKSDDGDSDSGDPPGHRHPVTPSFPPKTRNWFHHIRRCSRYWRVPSFKRVVGRWFA